MRLRTIVDSSDFVAVTESIKNQFRLSGIEWDCVGGAAHLIGCEIFQGK